MSVAGESGAGKSTLAQAIVDCRKASGSPAALLHLDDYYRYPPAENHARRVADLSRVGPGEVRMDALDRAARERAASEPLVVVEGTWATRLSSPAVHVFLERTYLDTRADRVARGRDLIDEFTPRILAIEHALIAVQPALAHLRVTPDWQLVVADWVGG